MRNLIALAVAFVMTSLLASEASAAVVQFTATVGQVRAGCSKAGGTFGVHADGRGYGCTKANCDGKGGSCTVHCDNNNSCTGTTPPARARATGDFMNILTNSKASPVAALPAGSGSILDGSGGFATQRPGAPVGGSRPTSAPQIR
ncbi:MAG: hypothetical protein K2Y27_17515 [Xanthobacteraceae bacterium]|nr:hypothetical protein [Xanthobacteraceae bacterium]